MTKPLPTKYPDNQAASANGYAVYEAVLKVLRAEFGFQCCSGYWYGSTAEFNLYAIRIPKLDDVWSLYAQLSMVPDKPLSGYVYPVYKSQYTVYHDNSKNGFAVKQAGPTWPLLDVAMSELIVRLHSLFEDSSFTFIDPPCP